MTKHIPPAAHIRHIDGRADLIFVRHAHMNSGQTLVVAYLVGSRCLISKRPGRDCPGLRLCHPDALEIVAE